jgi:soluble lytic murein transglycosylase
VNKSKCVILGAFSAFIAFQLPVNLGVASARSHGGFDAVPLFASEHSKELLEDSSGALGREIKNEDVAKFVFKRTRELLPVPFRKQGKRIASALIDAANRHQMDPIFLMAVIRQESAFRPEARGAHGEIGLMQIKPSTARWVLGFEKDQKVSDAHLARLLADPASNIRIGAAYMAKMREAFPGKSADYIGAYNMGAAKYRDKIGSGYQPREYSERVLARYVELAGSVVPSVKAHQFNAADMRRMVASRTFGR